MKEKKYLCEIKNYFIYMFVNQVLVIAEYVLNMEWELLCACDGNDFKFQYIWNEAVKSFYGSILVMSGMKSVAGWMYDFQWVKIASFYSQMAWYKYFFYLAFD